MRAVVAGRVWPGTPAGPPPHRPRCPRRVQGSGGGVKRGFGPKAFIVVSDPVVVRHLLRVRF